MIAAAETVPSGRYAPSPTGSLHLGNLRTALAAYASARARGLRFLLRIEDLDEARCRREFEERQLEDLAMLGIEWDDAPLRQTERGDVYTRALEELDRRRLVYPCFCSRKDIQEAASAPHGPGGLVYTGTCSGIPRQEARGRMEAGERHSWRMRVQQAPKSFFDGFAGDTPIDLEAEGGDFVVRRADGFFAYQIACAVDDALTGCVEVLRGADLMDSGARQAYILAALNLPVPRYIHIPLMMGPDGRRLAKRIGSEDLTGFLSRGYDAVAIRSYLGHTLGLCERGERLAMEEVVARWDVRRLPRENVIFDEQILDAFRPRA
jgi:glutamyl-tRNA synthetase